MKTIEIRRKNLRSLIEKYSGQAELVSAINQGLDASDKPLSPPQISQILGGRNFGEKLARKIEKGLTLEAFWIDIHHNSTKNSELSHVSEPDTLYNVKKGSLVPLISCVSAGEFKEIIDNFQPGYAEDWYMRPNKGSESVVAMKVDGDSMTAPYGKTYPSGCIIFIDPENRNPENGQPVLAKINGDDKITFKQFVIDGNTRFLRPLNPTYPPIMEKFRILGTVIGKYEDS